MRKAPCLNCPDRSPTCHGECEKYKQFKAEREVENAERYKERRSVQEMVDYSKNKWRRLN